jgi:hypothetical protein
LITQQTEITKRELSVQEPQTMKRPFVEPEISSPVDVLEATAFFQGIVGNSDVGVDVTG